MADPIQPTDPLLLDEQKKKEEADTTASYFTVSDEGVSPLVDVLSLAAQLALMLPLSHTPLLEDEHAFRALQTHGENQFVKDWEKKWKERNPGQKKIPDITQTKEWVDLKHGSLDNPDKLSSREHTEKNIREYHTKYQEYLKDKRNPLLKQYKRYKQYYNIVEKHDKNNSKVEKNINKDDAFTRAKSYVDEHYRERERLLDGDMQARRKKGEIITDDAVKQQKEQLKQKIESRTWDKFAQKFPEKTAAYAPQHEGIKKAHEKALAEKERQSHATRAAQSTYNPSEEDIIRSLFGGGSPTPPQPTTPPKQQAVTNKPIPSQSGKTGILRRGRAITKKLFSRFLYGQAGGAGSEPAVSEQMRRQQQQQAEQKKNQSQSQQLNANQLRQLLQRNNAPQNLYQRPPQFGTPSRFSRLNTRAIDAVNRTLNRTGEKLANRATSQAGNALLRQGAKFAMQRGAILVATATSEIWVPILLIILGILLLIIIIVLLVLLAGGNFDEQTANQNQNAIPGLTMTLNGPNKVENKQEISYTINVSYTGSLDVIITDPIPSGTSFVSATGTCSTCKEKTTVATWRLRDNATNATSPAPTQTTTAFPSDVYASYGFPKPSQPTTMNQDQTDRWNMYLKSSAQKAGAALDIDPAIIGMWGWLETNINSYATNCNDQVRNNSNYYCPSGLWQVGYGVQVYDHLRNLPEAMQAMHPGQNTQQVGQRVIDNAAKRTPNGDRITEPSTTFPEISIEKLSQDAVAGDKNARMYASILMRDDDIGAYLIGKTFKGIIGPRLAATMQGWQSAYYDPQKVINLIAGVYQAGINGSTQRITTSFTIVLRPDKDDIAVQNKLFARATSTGSTIFASGQKQPAPPPSSDPVQLRQDIIDKFGISFERFDLLHLQWAWEKLWDVSHTNFVNLVQDTQIQSQSGLYSWFMGCNTGTGNRALVQLTPYPDKEAFQFILIHELGHVVYFCHPKEALLDEHAKAYTQESAVSYYAANAKSCNAKSESIPEDYADMIGFYLNPPMGSDGKSCGAVKGAANPLTTGSKTLHHGVVQQLLGAY